MISVYLEILIAALVSGAACALAGFILANLRLTFLGPFPVKIPDHVTSFEVRYPFLILFNEPLLKMLVGFCPGDVAFCLSRADHEQCSGEQKQAG